MATLIEQLLIGVHEGCDVSHALAIKEGIIPRSVKGKNSFLRGQPQQLTISTDPRHQKYDDHVINDILDCGHSRAQTNINCSPSQTNQQKSQHTTDNTPQKVSSSMHKRTSSSKPTSKVQNSINISKGGLEKTENSSSTFMVAPHYAEVKEYMSWRLKRNKMRLARLECAAQIIQRTLRVFMARTMVKRLKRNSCATDIQRYFRGGLGRLECLAKRQQRWATKFTQRTIRGYLGRTKFFKRRKMVQAQVTISRIWRGCLARKLVTKIILQRNNSATTIQSLIRQLGAKTKCFVLRLEKASVIAIQRVYRGHLGRRKAEIENDKYIFSRSRSSGIEMGRQMLAEHKMQATKLQSEAILLRDEKAACEEKVNKLLNEIGTFESGFQHLEKGMHQLNKVEESIGSAYDGHAQQQRELREQKMRIDQEFSSMLSKISDRRDQLNVSQKQLMTIEKKIELKQDEVQRLERKLVVLLEAQQTQLLEIKCRQENSFKVTSLENSATPACVNHLSIGNERSANPTGISIQEKKQAAQLMTSTETMMKFGFMSMSMSYLSSINMMKAMKKAGVQDTVMATSIGTGVYPRNEVPLKSNESPLSPTRILASDTTQTKGKDTTKIVTEWCVQDVLEWLSGLGLGQYSNTFRDGAVDGAFLCALNENDLRNALGVEHSLHRKKLMVNIDHLRCLNQGLLERKYKTDVDTKEFQIRDSMATNATSFIREETSVPTLEANENQKEPHHDISATPISNMKPQRATKQIHQNAQTSLKLEDLQSWVRHQKIELLNKALQHTPDTSFDDTCVRVQFLQDQGTVYTKSYEKDSSGFQMNQTDSHSNNLLHVAAQNGNISIAKLLVKKGCNPNHQNIHGQTPGHFAIAYQFYDFATWLFDDDKGGANDTLANMHNLGPYDGLAPE